MKKYKSNSILLLSLLVLLSVPANSQEETMISPYIRLRYLKNTDDQRSLQTALTYSKDRMELPVPGMEISFYEGAGNKKLIAVIVTDNKGIAKLEFGKDMKLSVDTDGMWAFSSEYKGNDTIEACTSEITVRDVILEMALTVADSIKTIAINAFTRDKGKDIPVDGEMVTIYIPRMFSLLPIGEITLDEKGTGTLEFPSDLPGDKDGNLTIIAKFEENQIYGNVEKQSIVKWGVPTEYSLPKFHRALWTKTAPRWMIFTLSILLTGVWGHYLFAIISLVRIRKDAKRKESDNEDKL